MNKHSTLPCDFSFEYTLPALLAETTETANTTKPTSTRSNGSGGNGSANGEAIKAAAEEKSISENPLLSLSHCVYLYVR